MERKLPDGITPGRVTPTWTAETVPPALLRAHHTSVWAELVVVAGTVIFVEETDAGFRSELTAPDAIVIVPDRDHHIEPGPDAQFHVQFYDS